MVVPPVELNVATPREAVVPAGGWASNGENASDVPTVDIQKELVRLEFLPDLRGSVDGGYGPITSRAVAEWQYTRWLKADAIFGNTSKGIMFPPEGAIFGGDFSFARYSGEFLAARGWNWALRYLFPLTYNGGLRGKGLSKPEYDDLMAHGVDIPAYLHETDPTDPIFTFERGVRHAEQAEFYRNLNNLPPKPIIFNYDTDMAIADIPQLLEGLKGAASIVGLDRTWLYGEYDAVKAGFDAGLITGGFQTYGWSRGLWDERAQYRQWSNGQSEYGAGPVDFGWKMPVTDT